jgi:hypothetical protein
MRRKYLHWSETREPPEAPRREVPEPSHVATDADIRKAAEELRSLREKRLGKRRR